MPSRPLPDIDWSRLARAIVSRYTLTPFGTSDFADACQDCIVSMLRAERTWKPDGGMSLTSWLWKHGRYGLLDRHRHERGRADRAGVHVVPMPVDPAELSTNVGSPTVTPADHFDAADVLARWITTLTVQQQQVIRWRLAGLTLARIGNRLGVTESRVSQILAPLKARCRAAFDAV